MDRRRKNIIFSIVCILVGIIVVGTCSFFGYNQLVFYIKNQNAEGVITDKWFVEYDIDQGGVTFEVYGYEVQFVNGKTGGQVTASFTHGDYKIGDKIQIYYDPDNPINISVSIDQSISNKPTLTFLGPILAVSLMGVISLIAGILTVRNRWNNPY